jgi:hypothetical protein
LGEKKCKRANNKKMGGGSTSPGDSHQENEREMYRARPDLKVLREEMGEERREESTGKRG